MSFKSYILLFLVILSSVYAQTEIQNLDDARAIVKEYYESGRYSAELKAIVDEAIDELENTTLPENATAVFDIDDTVLSSYEYTKSLAFGFSWDTWIVWMNEGKCSQIPETKELYDWFVANKVKVIFLTGRHDDTLEATRNNLIEAGFTAIDSLICRSAEDKEKSASDYKTSHRKSLAEAGYEIIACIGDQMSDLEGSFTGKKIKLPNYLYLIK